MNKTIKTNAFLSLFFLLALVFGTAGQTAKTAKQKPDAALGRLRSTVNYLTSDKLAGRRAGEPGAMSAAGYIAGEFARIGLRAGVNLTSKNVNPAKSAKAARGFLQPFPLSETATGYNVVGILPGNDANLKNEAIVIGAHYDHLGRGGEGSLAANSTEVHKGADDNASGVAGLLELARVFAAEKKIVRRTIIFIAFGGEEAGLIGSRFYVNNPAFPLDKTAAMINLDMIGRLKDDKLTIFGTGTASEWKDLIAAKNEQQPNTALPKMINAPVTRNIEGFVGVASAVAFNAPIFSLVLNDDGFGASDHSSFYAKQIPVLFFFSGLHLDYHRPTDTAEKINFDGVKKIVSFVAEIAHSIDKNDKRPTYAAAKTLGAGDGRRSFGVSLGTIPGYGDTANDGLLLDGVRENSPAAKAGLQAGDKIVGLAGKEIKNITGYTGVLSELKAGEEYEIEIRRGAETLRLKIIPAARKQ